MWKIFIYFASENLDIYWDFFYNAVKCGNEMGHEFMKKLICIMVLVCSCCFAGCSGSVSSIGEDFCDALFGGKYEEAASMMSGAMRSDMGEDEAASLLKSVEEQCGTYESARYVASETANDYTFVTVELQCAEGKLQAVVCLDDDRVAGMQLYSDSGETLEESDATADSATAAAFVNALFAEDYETAGSMMPDLERAYLSSEKRGSQWKQSGRTDMRVSYLRPAFFCDFCNDHCRGYYSTNPLKRQIR